MQQTQVQNITGVIKDRPPHLRTAHCTKRNRENHGYSDPEAPAKTIRLAYAKKSTTKEDELITQLIIPIALH